MQQNRRNDRDGQRRGRKKVCYFTQNHIEHIDFKDVDLLRKFVTDRGKILPRRYTGNSLKYQKKVALAIKRARHLALLPFVSDNLK